MTGTQKLIIKQRTVTLTSADGEKEYDGTPLTKNAQTDVTVGGDGFVDGEGATYDITGSQTLVGSSKNTFDYTLKSNTKAENYKINKTEGTLTVTDKDIPDDLVVKKNDDKADSYKYAEGETVTFAIEVTNVYAEAKDITLKEIAGVNLAQSTFKDVAAGATVTTTATYVIKPADMAKGSFTNTVTATLEGKDYTATDTVQTKDVEAGLKVTKIASKTSDAAVGDVITYTVVVTNSGNATVKDITLSDTLVTLSEEAFDLAPGKDKTITYTYTVQQKDVDTGKIDNKVTATGKDPKNEDVTDDAECTVTAVKATPELTVTKTANPTSGVGKGATVTYTVVVKNTGNVTVTDITLSDTLVTLTGDNAAAFDLAPGKDKTITYTYEVTQADVDKGKIDNTVTATGKDPSEGKVTKSASASVTTIDSDAELTVTKTALPASGVKVGDTVNYTVVVTNTGNVTVKDVTLDDTLVTLTDAQKAVGTLAPAGTKTITYTYTVTQADVDAGKINNTVTATGIDNKEKPITTSANATVTTVDAKPELTVTKTPDPASGVKVGDEITYTVVVTNTGNVTVSSIAMSDTLVNLSEEAFNLAPAGTKEITYTYKVQQKDVDAGKIDNTVTATGKDPKNGDVTGTAKATVTTEEAKASIKVTKTADPTKDVKVDGTVTYTVTVENTGNVTVSDINLSDTLVTLNVAPFTLAPTETKKDISYTYTVKQSDVDAGKIDNTVTATGKDPKNVDVTGTASATVTTEEAKAELTVSKTATPATGVQVGGTVTYTVVVKNTGNVTVTGITLKDDKLKAVDAPAAFDLAPEKEKTITYTYTVTQNDVDEEEINNTVTATGKDPKNKDVTGTASAKVTPVESDAKLVVNKTAKPATGVKVGDTVTYTVNVTNNGNVTVKDIAMSDSLVTLEEEAFTLTPAGSKSFTYTYNVTQADVDAGKIDNTVTAKGKDPKGTEVSNSATAKVTTEDADAKLAVTKEAKLESDGAIDAISDALTGNKAEVGDTITYTVVVTNNGNVTVSDIELSDTLVTLNEKAFDLAPAGTKKITYTYTVTQADVDAGKIDNIVTATGKDPKNADVTGTDDAEVTAADAKPALTVEKTASPKEGVKLGDTVTYTVKVTNSGNVTVSGIALSDTLVTLNEEAFDLAPAGTKTVTYTYTVTQADVDAGKIDNTVTATGKDPKKDDVTGTANATVTTVAPEAALTVTKTATPTSGVGAGATVTYTVKVANSGNVTVTGITLKDTLVTLTGDNAAAFDLAPGKEKTITYTYDATQADVDAGKIDNTVTATGKDPKNKDVDGTASVTVTTVDSDAKLAVTKTAKPASGVKVGDTVTYTVNVTNNGNVTVKDIVLTDSLVTLTEEAFTLAPAGTKTITYTYEVTQADVDAGKIDNTVTAKGTDPKGTEVSNSAKATVTTVTADPKLTVEKTAEPTEGVKAGDTVTYTVKVTNSGNVTVSSIAMSDTLVNLSEEAFNLAPAGTKTITYTYKVTQADVDAGKIDNTVTATGKDPKNADVTGTDKATVTTVAADAKLTVKKTADPTKDLKVNDTVTYTVVVTNSGNVTVTGIALSDTLVTLNEEAFDLAPAGTKTITYEYTVTQADVDAGKIDNTVTATGKDPKNADVTGTDKATVTTVEANAAIEVTKTATPKTGVGAGAEVAYKVTVENTGNVTVTGIKLEDTLVDDVAKTAAFDLAPGAKKEITYTYTATQADVDAGQIDNTVTATGKDPKENDVTDDDSVTVKTVDSDAKLDVTKTAAPASGLEVDNTVKYTVKVTNSGNVTVKNITLSDTLVTVTDGAFDLAPGTSKTVTYNYTVTQADVDAGKIDNTVTAAGKDPKNNDVTNTASATVTTAEANADLTVEKTADPATNVKVGDTVKYTVKVTNSGNVTVSSIAMSDTLVTLNEKAFDLAPGNDKTITYTYTVTQADVDAGKIDNTVTATGKDPKNADVTGTDKVTVTAVKADPELTVTKTAEPTEGVAVDDEVTYTVVVTNSGNVTVSGIKLTDALMSADDAPAAFNLAPGASKTVTYTYTVTQADVDAGKIDNTATATGKDPKGEDVTKSATATVTAEAAEAKLSIDKSADQTTAVKVGDTIQYTVVVKNEGNVTVTDGKLKDTLVDLKGETFELAPGEEAVFDYEYTVTQDDLDTGEFTNTVKANAEAIRGKDPAEVEDSVTVTTETATAGLSITKKAEPTEDVAVGDEITYTVVVKNVGNVSVKDGKLADDHADLSKETFSLKPGEEAEFEYTYTVTQDDFDAREIKNVVTANATAVRGDNPEEVTATATVKAAEKKAHLNITKVTTSTAAAEDGKYALGEEITYKITATNDGNVTLHGIQVTDELTGDVWNVEGALAPGESKEFETSYTVTEADILAGEVLNVATGKATDPQDDPDVPVDPGKDPEPTEEKNGHLTLDKETTSTAAAEDGKYALGEEITYKITATNDGNLTLTDIKVNDELTDEKWTVDSLAPGESKEFETSYTVTEADILAGEVVNVATGSVKSPDPDDPKPPVDPDPEPQPTEEKNGHLTLDKETTSTAAAADGKYALGEEITYKITATNDGNLTLTDIVVEDELTGKSWTVKSLAPGESKKFETSYTVTEADILAGEVVNVATGSVKSPDPDDPNPPVDPDPEPQPTEDKNGHLTVDKETTSTPAKDGKYALGETVSYKITVTNDGNLTITDIEVSDDLTGDTWTIESLAPGASKTFTTSHDVTEADILAGKVHNVATAKGKSPDPDKPDVPVDPGTKDDPTEDKNGHLTVDKVTTSTPANGKTYALDETITYEITVTNDGNLTITDIEISDQLEGFAFDEGQKTSGITLKPGESVTVTGSYTVTEEDILAEEVVNVATAKGKSPDPDKPNVPVDPGEDPEPTDDPAPSIDVEKSSNKVDGKDVPAGTDLTYTVKVTNTGNVTLNNITLTDDHGTPADFDTSLAPGASTTATYTYTVTKADDEAGSVTNTVVGEGTGTNGETVTDTDSITTIVGTNNIVPIPDPDDEDEEMSADGKDITVMYDGEKHTVSAEASKPGSTIYYSTDGGETWTKEAPTRVDVGVTEFWIKATNPDYEDVIKDGYTLTVTKRPITLTSASDQKVYDGTPLVRNQQSDVKIGGKGLADTDKLTFNITGSQTYVGSSDNEFTYEFSKKARPLGKAVDALKSYFTAFGAEDEPSIADNYDIKVAYGTLTVTDDGVDPDDVITKTHENKEYKVGDTITFTIKATNIYDEVKTITIVEQEGVTLAQSVFNDVKPGETVETTATYKVTENDAKSGKFTNVVTAQFDGGKNFSNDDTVDHIKGADGKSHAPNTGDNGFGFDMTMMFGSAAAFLAMLFGRRRREQE